MIRTKYYLALVMVYSLTLATFSCSDARKDDAPSMTEAELLAATHRLDSIFLDAFNKGDVDQFMQTYWKSPEVTAYPPVNVMQLKGYDAIKEFYTRDFASNKGGRLEYVSNDNILFKDGVISHGTFRWTLPIPGSEPIVFEARHTVVKAIRDGKLVIVLDHTSTPTTPEQAGEEKN